MNVSTSIICSSGTSHHSRFQLFDFPENSNYLVIFYISHLFFVMMSLTINYFKIWI
ncbi:hypothetical protein C1646_690134 [Rhizophagus diaphanus]|nr:hypothetical protein C1646_690134 [Rhizophagus diaphanus] [Rhizophagus sp. MUCL 43196]